MLKSLLLASLLIMLSACGDNTESTHSEQHDEAVQLTLLEQYRNQAAYVLGIINTNNDANKLQKESAKLVILSQSLLKDLTVEVPQCTHYLASLNAAAADMASLPVEKIASDYLLGKKLPSFEQPICYHIKELLVHGAMVQAIAHKGLNNSVEYKTVELDMIEAMAHFEQVEAELAD